MLSSRVPPNRGWAHAPYKSSTTCTLAASSVAPEEVVKVRAAVGATIDLPAEIRLLRAAGDAVPRNVSNSKILPSRMLHHGDGSPKSKLRYPITPTFYPRCDLRTCP